MDSSEVLRKLCFGIKQKRKKEDERSTKQLILNNVPENLKKVLRDEIVIERKEADGNSNEEGSQEIPILAGTNIVLDSNNREKKRERKKEGVDPSQRSEALARLRRLNRIFTWGEDVAEPILDWTDLQLPSTLSQALASSGMLEPTPVQMQAIPVMVQHRNLLASAPTGSGKTLAFCVPVILDVIRLKKRPKYSKGNHLFAIILEPTHDLANQTYSQMVAFGDELGVGSCLLGEKGDPKTANVIVCTLNRLIFSLPSLLIKPLRWLVVDESDRLFDASEGNDRSFRLQLATIYKATESCKWIRRSFFSATFSYEVEEWCKENLENVAMICVGERFIKSELVEDSRNSANTQVTQELLFTGSEQGKVVAFRQLLKHNFKPPAMVFVQSKDRARQLMEMLSSLDMNIPAALISSERPVQEREASLTALREGKIWLLFCTELAGRGLDLPSVNLVVNFDIPTSIISYIHRIGRTGRAGRTGKAVTYFTEEDMVLVRPIANIIHKAGFPVPDYTLSLKPPTRKEKKAFLRRAPMRKDFAKTKKKVKKRREEEKE